jgi:hypothetical protein
MRLIIGTASLVKFLTCLVQCEYVVMWRNQKILQFLKIYGNDLCYKMYKINNFRIFNIFTRFNTVQPCKKL